MREWNDDLNPFNSTKVLCWREHLEGCARGDFLSPVVVNWDLVLGCNYRCKYCIWAKRQGIKPTRVPFELAIRVPDFLYHWGVKACCIAGEWGDPALYPQLAEILRELHKWNIDVGLVSNGKAYSEKQLEAAAHYTRFTGFSVDAGTPEAYAAVHNTVPENFRIVTDHMDWLAEYATMRNLPVEIGYKFLVYPENYHTIYRAARLAKDIGCRDFQCRPAWLSIEDTERINVDVANQQMEDALGLADEDFRVATVRHKFTDDFKKKKPAHCYATPITSTWCANGEVHLCVDRRDMADDILCNYRTDGLDALRRAWNGDRHHQLVRDINRSLDKCKRCTNYRYNVIIERCIIDDDMDRRLV